MLLVSNMYPSKKAPNYGVFVKNTEQLLRRAGIDAGTIVLHKQFHKSIKLLSYAGYYMKIIVLPFFKHYDLVYVHYAAQNAWPVLFLKKLKKNLPVIVNVHGSDVVPETTRQEKFQPAVSRLMKTADKIIAPSHYFKQLVADKYQVAAGKVAVFPSGGVDHRLFFPNKGGESQSRAYGLEPGKAYVGYVGRIDPGKGWEIFIRALAGLKAETDFFARQKAVIAGDGRDYQKMVDQIAAAGLQKDVTLLGMRPQSQLKDIYNCLSVFCFPTMRQAESLGLVGLEAMACGVPVIASRIGGIQDYLEDGVNGLFFSPGNAEELAAKIIEYTKFSDQKKNAMKAACLETAARYDSEAIEPAFVRLFLPDQGRTQNIAKNEGIRRAPSGTERKGEGS